jgi:hypothetical protein
LTGQTWKKANTVEQPKAQRIVVKAMTIPSANTAAMSHAA